MSKRITRFEANQPDWQITIQYVGTPCFERVPAASRPSTLGVPHLPLAPVRATPLEPREGHRFPPGAWPSRAPRAARPHSTTATRVDRCRYSMPFRWLTKPVWKMKTHFNELFNVYKDERIDLKTVRLSRKIGGEELTDVGSCGKHLKDGDVLTLAPRDGTVCENLDEMECVTFQMGDGIYW